MSDELIIAFRKIEKRIWRNAIINWLCGFLAGAVFMSLFDTAVSLWLETR